MLKLSVCVEMLFREHDFPDRIRKVADLGINGFEFWRQENKDLEAIAKLRDDLKLTWVGMVGTSRALTDVADNTAVLSDLQQSIALAKDLHCQSLIVTSGPSQPDVDLSKQHENIVTILQEAAPMAEEAAVTIALEPLNTAVNHPGTYLSSSYEGYEIVRKVNSPRVKLLFDIYHQQITEGNVIANMTNHMELIGHVHLADVPGRHEPGTGELNYKNILRAIADSNYDGYVGCEFAPSGTSTQALDYVKTLV